MRMCNFIHGFQYKVSGYYENAKPQASELGPRRLGGIDSYSIMPIISNAASKPKEPRFSGTLYPDRSFTVGAVPPRQKSLKDIQYDRDYESQFDSYVTCETHNGSRRCEEHRFFQGIDSYNRFIKGPKLSQKRGNYGSKGITGYGRKLVRCSASLLQERFGKARLGFCTATVPNYDAGAISVINREWGYIVKRFFEELRRVVERAGNVLCYVAVTEIQEKRFDSTGLPVPHLHWIYVCRDGKNKPFYISADEMRRIWSRTLQNVLRKANIEGFSRGIESNAAIDCTVVRKSCAAYLGKYMSKGGKVLKSMIEKGFTDFPRRWWSACAMVKKMFRESLIRLDTKTCEAFFYGIEHYLHEGIFEWASFVTIEIDGHERTMGMVGTLSEDAYALLL